MKTNEYIKSKKYQYHPKRGYFKIKEEQEQEQEQETIAADIENEVPIVETVKPKKKHKKDVKHVKEESDLSQYDNW